MKYNGWKNYETWNVWAWLTEDRPLYEALTEYAHRYGKYASYHGFLNHIGFTPAQKTPDGIQWWDETLDVDRLDECIQEEILEN